MNSRVEVIESLKITLTAVFATCRSTSNLVSCGVVNLSFGFKPPMLRCGLTTPTTANNPIPMTTSKPLII